MLACHMHWQQKCSPHEFAADKATGGSEHTLTESLMEGSSGLAPEELVSGDNAIDELFTSRPPQAVVTALNVQLGAEAHLKE